MRGNALLPLGCCSGHQKKVSIKVRENEEVEEDAGNRPKITPNVGTANLPLLALPIPAAACPSIAPETITTGPPEETDLVHFLADVVLHEGERRGAEDAPHIQLSVPPSTDSQRDNTPHPNPADRLMWADREGALRRCNFLDPESINAHYPT